MASYRRGYENNRQRNRAFPRPSGMSDPMQRLELMPDYQPMQPMPRPMEATPRPEGYEPIRPMPPRSYGDDMRSIAYEPEPMGPMGPIGGPRGPIMDEIPRRPRMPDQGRDEVGLDKMNRMMELLKRSAQPNADTQYTPPRPQSRLEEMSEKLNPGMHTQDTETTERVGREQREAKEFFRNNPNQQPISQFDDPRDMMQTKQYKGPSKAEYDEMMLKYRDTRPLDVQRAENAERAQKRQDMISGMPDKYGKSYGAPTPTSIGDGVQVMGPTPPQMPQQMYSLNPGEDYDDYQDRVTASQQADPNFNLDLYQQQLRDMQGMQTRQPQMPMMMSRGGSAWRGSLPQGYEADEDLRAQALADINAGADMDGDNLISDEELYNWRPSDSRYGTNPNNRVNRDQSYSQAALDTLRRKGAEMGDDGVFSEDEFWKFDAARQQNEGQNYGGATLEGEFNYQDPSTWNAPQPPMPMPEPMSPSQTTYVPEPAPNPYVFGGYGSPPPQYAGMADPRMTNIVGMAPPSYYGGAEE